VYLAYLLLPLRLFLQLGRVAGWLEMLVRPAARRDVRVNLEKAFGKTKSKRELARLTRKVFEHHEMRLIMLLVAPLMAVRGQLQRGFPVLGLDHLDRALEMGKGAIVLTAHINSIGTLLAVIQLRQRGYDIRCPMPDRRDAWPLTPFRRLVHRLFKAPTVSEIMGAFYAQFNVRPLMTVLREGSVLLLVGDGWHSASFVDVEFLGRRLPFTSGPLNLARLADAPVVPLFSVGEPQRMRFEFEPAFKVDRSGVQSADVARAVTFFIGRVEQRMLADVPNWQHWLVEDVFGTLEGWRERPIQERYAV
jgi:Kdo2-lipid IVA lauroyltransferase/acyltransferase